MLNFAVSCLFLNVYLCVSGIDSGHVCLCGARDMGWGFGATNKCCNLVQNCGKLREKYQVDPELPQLHTNNFTYNCSILKCGCENCVLTTRHRNNLVIMP